MFLFAFLALSLSFGPLKQLVRLQARNIRGLGHKSGRSVSEDEGVLEMGASQL